MTTKDPNNLTYFSFVEPWGYEDSCKYFTEMQNKIEGDQKLAREIYVHRELLGYSKEMRYVELVTLTGKTWEEGEGEEVEEKIEGEGLFPEFEDGTEESKIFSRKRCLKLNKPVVFLTARVHPGEV